MASSIVGYTNDLTAEKIVYTGKETSTAEVIIDNDPDSSTYSQIGAKVKISTNTGNALTVDNKGLFVQNSQYDDTQVKAGIAANTASINALNTSKQDKLTAGQNITIVNGVISATDQDTKDYERLNNKPSVNGVELNGELSLQDLGISIPTKLSELYNDKGYIVRNDISNLATKESVEAKQDRLTAGSNITIIDNVISATGGEGKVKTVNNIEPDANGNVVINIPDTSSLATKVELQEVEESIPSKTSQLTNDSGFLTEHQSLAGYATESWVEGKSYATKTWVEDKHYLTQHQDISNLATKTELQEVQETIPTKTSELTNDSGFLTEHQSIKTINNQSLIGSGNITIEGGDAKLGQALTASVTVGGIAAGTTFTADTKLANIIIQMLSGSAPVTGVTIYKGVVNTKPTTATEIEALTSATSKTKSDLLAGAYQVKRLNPNNQYVVLAIPKSVGIYCEAIKVNGFSIGFNEVEIGDYYMYVEDNPATLSNITYEYYFAEV